MLIVIECDNVRDYFLLRGDVHRRNARVYGAEGDAFRARIEASRGEVCKELALRIGANTSFTNGAIPRIDRDFSIISHFATREARSQTITTIAALFNKK